MTKSDGLDLVRRSASETVTVDTHTIKIKVVLMITLLSSGCHFSDDPTRNLHSCAKPLGVRTPALAYVKSTASRDRLGVRNPSKHV